MKRDDRLDLLRAIAIIMVLIIHSATRYVHTPAEALIGGWFSQFSRPCIAIFLFLAGTFFITNDLNYGYLLKKIKRVLWPYLFFSFFAIIYSYRGSFIKILKDIDNIIIRLILGDSFGIYYFCFIIIIIYIIAFIVDKIIPLEENIFYILVGSFILGVLDILLYNKIQSFLGQRSEYVKTLYQYRSILTWLPYFFLGCYYRLFKLQNMIQARKYLIRTIWVFIFLIYNTVYFIINRNVDAYHSIMGLIYSLSTIGLLLSFDIVSKKYYLLSNTSYTIYLAHIFFIYLIVDIGKYFSIIWPFEFSLISFFISLIGSLLVYRIGKRVFKTNSYLIIGAN
jgi:surface polysaccharide O-acyltransferase-like enzyme